MNGYGHRVSSIAYLSDVLKNGYYLHSLSNLAGLVAV